MNFHPLKARSKTTGAAAEAPVPETARLPVRDIRVRTLARAAVSESDSKAVSSRFTESIRREVSTTSSRLYIRS